ncbi:MAG: rod shape-determining protein RodA [Dongiaceae bacterium]
MIGGPQPASLGQKLYHVNWGLLIVLCMVAAFGLAMLYSAANGNVDPWASRQALRFGLGLVILLAVASIDLRIWLAYAYWIYLASFLLLIYVEVAGQIGMGAQRWIDLKLFQLQPSEVVKIATILALARYFHHLDHERIGRPWMLIPPIAMVLAPAGLVLVQPDLGTAGMLVLIGAGMFFVAGVRWWKFALVAAGAGAAVPIAWNFLHDYQKNRIRTFMNPESDPLGAGYHSLQSKIAFGSGGMFGKGFLAGTQSHLNFLPERQTDFIFTMVAEELGMVGCLVLLGLYAVLVGVCIAIALRCRNHFGRLLVMGLTINLFLYLFINAAMVMGLIPVVGVPLPLISYGGTAMITVMIGFGLVMSAHINERLRAGRLGPGEEG